MQPGGFVKSHREPSRGQGSLSFEAGCPKQIKIPDLFAVMNTKQIYHDWNADYYYNVVHTAPGCKASDCIKCGKCEKACPQHLHIRDLLVDVAKEFEKK